MSVFILVLSGLLWFFAAAWEWRVPQGLETRIIEFQAKLSAPVPQALIERRFQALVQPKKEA